MTRRSTTWRMGHVLSVMLVLIPACAKKADMTAAPEASAGDDLAVLEQQLAARESQLRGAGFEAPAQKKELAEGDARVEEAAPAPEPTSTPTAPAKPASAGADANDDEAHLSRKAAPGGRCEQVCEISAAICGLRDQICGLVPRHPGDPRYQAACDRAAADCQFSTEACHGCTDP